MSLIKKLTHTAPDGTVTVRRFLTNKGLAKAFLVEIAESFARQPEGGDGKVYIDGVLTHTMTPQGVITEVEPKEAEDVRN